VLKGSQGQKLVLQKTNLLFPQMLGLSKLFNVTLSEQGTSSTVDY